MAPNVCGCKACGGAQYAADSRVALRIAAMAPFIAFRRHATPQALANRVQRPDLYTRLVMGAR